jgi:hypothetical protein
MELCGPGRLAVLSVAVVGVVVGVATEADATASRPPTIDVTSSDLIPSPRDGVDVSLRNVP